MPNSTPASDSDSSGILVDNPEAATILPIMSETPSKQVKIAAVQAEPAWNDLQGGVDKVCALVKEAASNGANVLGFPEVFIPGYPWYDSAVVS